MEVFRIREEVADVQGLGGHRRLRRARTVLGVVVVVVVIRRWRGVSGESGLGLVVENFAEVLVVL